MQTETSSNITQVKNIDGNIDFSLLLHLIINVILLIIIFMAIGLFIDYLKKDKYNVKKIWYRTPYYGIGGGEEYYLKYWVWQPNKKKYLETVLERKLGHNRTYSRKARAKNKNKKSAIPFRREVYGNIR